MQYLYVCHFSNGHIKVGRSSDPKSRIAQHEERVSCLGVLLVESHIAECVGHIVAAEFALISICANHADTRNKNEWFIGLDFDAVCGWANSEAGRVRSESIGPVELIVKLGGPSAVALLLGISQSSVSEWKMRGLIPDGKLIRLAPIAEARGITSRKVLFPDDWQLIWPELVKPKAVQVLEQAD